MTIKEAERRTGLTRSSIRFYEKENLIAPARDGGNGYRNYSEGDVERIKRIAYLRTLEIPVEDIRAVIEGKAPLLAVLEKQKAALEGRIEGLNRAKALCEKMIEDGNVRFDELRVEAYAENLTDYWRENRAVFKLDAAGFLNLWGSLAAWAVIASLCLALSALSYGRLPPEIPVQWSEGVATSLADRRFIFAYPLACVLLRALLRPCLLARLTSRGVYGAFVTEYLTNGLCFIALSIEAFSILFVCGLARSVLAVLAADAAFLGGALLLGMRRMGLLRQGSGRV